MLFLVALADDAFCCCASAETFLSHSPTAAAPRVLRWFDFADRDEMGLMGLRRTNGLANKSSVLAAASGAGSACGGCFCTEPSGLLAIGVRCKTSSSVPSLLVVSGNTSSSSVLVDIFLETFNATLKGWSGPGCVGGGDLREVSRRGVTTCRAADGCGGAVVDAERSLILALFPEDGPTLTPRGSAAGAERLAMLLARLLSLGECAASLLAADLRRDVVCAICGEERRRVFSQDGGGLDFERLERSFSDWESLFWRLVCQTRREKTEKSAQTKNIHDPCTCT